MKYLKCTPQKLLSLLLIFLAANAFSKSPVETYGHLAVVGNKIVGSQGNTASLAGPSFFWSNTGWGAEIFYNSDVVRHLKTEWNASLIRAAIGGEGPGGYNEDPKGNYQRASALADAAIAEGLYVIIDWHTHHAEDRPDLAIEFFSRIATQYGKHPNVIYEIYNEPLDNTDWKTTIKPYAETVIAAIRKIDPDNLIVVGTQTWSQDVDIAANAPITGYDNIAYALHFYAGTHKQELRDKAEIALNKGIALMVTEWGTVNADGDGDVATESVEEWLTFIKKHELSFCTWSMHNKKEGASILKPNTKPDGKWTDDDLTKNGLYLKKIISNW
ncbi:glycoside hydrolase family 5 protein [Teredinibacter purpureus]|uniref:glycoside hydrolase family 5 protein n=1 Tax=Teredinibacter purpureus TaxID=2731756 RepID=UPI0005F7E9A4|nr:glycoside hydrolase family 5 protein [Teredinibacter purpureus]